MNYVDEVSGYMELQTKTVRAGRVQAETEQPNSTIMDFIRETGEHRTLEALIHAAGFESILATRGPFTLLAPFDDAFLELSRGTLDEWMRPQNKFKLQAVVSGHILPGRFLRQDLLDSSPARTAYGSYVNVSGSPDEILVNESIHSKDELLAANGVVHIIDKVIHLETPAILRKLEYV